MSRRRANDDGAYVRSSRNTATSAWLNGTVGGGCADVAHARGALYVHLLSIPGVGRPLYTGQTYEADETALLQRTLGPGMIVVDVGANVGYMALLSALSVQPAACWRLNPIPATSSC